MIVAVNIALFRYSLIREAADPDASKTERGLLVRALAGRDHAGLVACGLAGPTLRWSDPSKSQYRFAPATATGLGRPS